MFKSIDIIMNTAFDQKIILRYLSLMMNDPHHRYWSWDHCFKAFSAEKDNQNLSLSLAFYLASWGMYRGSGGLLQKNHLVHEKSVEIISSGEYRPIRCSTNQEVSISLIPLILDLKAVISSYYSSLKFTRGGLNHDFSDTDTLLSKILLGTTGCVPAYDRYFILGMKKSKLKCCTFTKNGLVELFDFVKSNQKSIKQTQDFVIEKTNHYYPIMKIIDMYFWQIGYDFEMENKKAS